MHKHGRCTPAATTVSGWLAVWVGVRTTQVLAADAYAMSLHMCPARMQGVLWGGEMATWRELGLLAQQKDPSAHSGD